MTLIFLGVSLIGLIYVWLESRTQVWRFGILPERLVRQLVSLVAKHTGWERLDGLRGGGLTDYHVVLPLRSQAISQLPKQMYEGESELIILHPSLQTSEGDDSIFVVDLVTRPDGRVMKKLMGSRMELENYALLKLTRQQLGKSPPKNHVKYLAIELIAPGFEIAGEKTQRQDLGSSLTYTWGITAKSSGNHKIALVLRAESETGGEIAQIGTIIHEIRVASIAGLTYRQVRMLKAVLAAITTTLGILIALQKLHVLP